MLWREEISCREIETSVENLRERAGEIWIGRERDEDRLADRLIERSRYMYTGGEGWKMILYKVKGKRA